MHASQSDSGMGDNVWQGYVSAVACLLLSLLLLMSVLALAMVALGGQKDTPSPPGPLLAPVTIPNSTPTVPKAQRGAQWALRFPVNTVEIRAQDHAVIAQKLALVEQNNISIQWHWSLWCIANSESQSSQRLAYLRLMSAREVLIKQGVQPEAISMEIRPSAVTDATADETLVMVSRTHLKTLESLGFNNVSP
jgi:hypothetical protein